MADRPPPRWMVPVAVAIVVASSAAGYSMKRDGGSAVTLAAARGPSAEPRPVPLPDPGVMPTEATPPAPGAAFAAPTPPTSVVKAPAPVPTRPEPGDQPAPAAATPAGAEAGEDLSPGRYQERPDTANFVVHPAGTPAVAGSATAIGSGPERLRFAVTVADDGIFTARLVNVSGRTMRFALGLHVVAQVTLDGQPWRTIDLFDAATTELAAGHQVSVTASIPFDRPGQYSAWGSTDIEIV